MLCFLSTNLIQQNLVVALTQKREDGFCHSSKRNRNRQIHKNEKLKRLGPQNKIGKQKEKQLHHQFNDLLNSGHFVGIGCVMEEQAPPTE